MRLDKKGKFWLKLILAILVFGSIIFALNFFQREVKGFFYSASSPIQKFFWSAGGEASNFCASIMKGAELKRETDDLKLKNQELSARIIELENLRQENEVLRQALGVNLQSGFNLVLAQITGKDISQDFITIDKGSDAGIIENMPVITSQKVAVGKISEVYRNFSKVMLITNKKSSFGAEVDGRDVSGVLKGRGDLNAFLDLIPRDKNISEGDTIITSNLSGLFPVGLLIGKIVKIKKNDVESLQQGEIELAFDVRSANSLFVITNR